jgi:hypothetical protein
MASSLRVREAALIHDMALQIVLHRRTVAEFGPASLEAGIAHQPDLFDGTFVMRFVPLKYSAAPRSLLNQIAHEEKWLDGRAVDD